MAHLWPSVSGTASARLTAQKRLVEAGFGLGLMPESTVQEELRLGTLRALKFFAMRLAVPVVLVHRRRGVLSGAARSVITPKNATATLMPPLLLQCRLDGKPCAPGDNESQIQFKLPPLRVQMLCCDTRAFTWVVPRVSRGSHTVVIWGQIRNPELAEIAQVGDWSLVIQAFGQ